MGKIRASERVLDFYTIEDTNNVVRAGDCVLLTPKKGDNQPYVGRLETIFGGNKERVKVKVRWYYRPEDTPTGRRSFHGAKELFLSDHYDTENGLCIEGKCIVHSFNYYTKMDYVSADDYYCRFEYKSESGAFTPDVVAVYCKCQMPYNPDDLMLHCSDCKDWFHPACVKMTVDQAKQLQNYVCDDCSSQSNEKSNDKVDGKRQNT